jgi:ABC-type lipoprotein release transport system permease subunit
MDPHPLGRLLNILDYAISSLRRKLLKNLLVLVVFTAVVFLFSSLLLTKSALTDMAGQLLAAAPDITVQQLSGGRQVSITTAAEDQLQGIPGIRQIRKRIWGYYFDEKNGANYTVIGLPQSKAEESSNLGHILAEGRLPQPEEQGKVALSAAVRQQLGLGERRFFSLFRPDLKLLSFEVIGILADISDPLAADTILMNEADARALFAVADGQVTDLLVAVANPLEIETIAMKISERLPGVRVITKNRINKTYRAVFGWRSGFAAGCLLLTLSAFVILSWDKASGLSGEELREVGILKILGWQTGDILLLRFYEALLIALLAFLSGWLLAWIHVASFQAALFRPIMLGWSVLRPNFALLPPLAATDLLLVFSVSVLPYLAATAVPAWRAATVPAHSVL